ncbi:MAG: restriction endonuclease subunit S, partial [Candidatus Binatia bacterium]|nr:restriction endonuclease subunit S [Candidatus Binatia bacterium]
HFAKPGDLLFSRANTTELVGAVAYVESTPPNVLLPDKLWRFVWREPAAIEPLFVWVLFQTPTLRREIGQRATGTSGSMKNISQEKVFGIRTILPPIELQREFARRVRAVEKLKTVQRASLAELDGLFATLQHRAFRGEL